MNETGAVSRHSHAFQNALPGCLRQRYGLHLPFESHAERGRRLVQICSAFRSVHLQHAHPCPAFLQHLGARQADILRGYKWEFALERRIEEGHFTRGTNVVQRSQPVFHETARAQICYRNRQPARRLFQQVH